MSAIASRSVKQSQSVMEKGVYLQCMHVVSMVECETVETNKDDSDPLRYLSFIVCMCVFERTSLRVLRPHRRNGQWWTISAVYTNWWHSKLRRKCSWNCKWVFVLMHVSCLPFAFQKLCINFEFCILVFEFILNNLKFENTSSQSWNWRTSSLLNKLCQRHRKIYLIWKACRRIRSRKCALLAQNSPTAGPF